ncbi:hypothetical protein E2C01_050017 [Portunus trituberculatus]|uniref:Uncharacterized protein n=1 Tax=Portunus trituberculatus TaxID=210409 RepID=A0A5B7GFI5_PORTR|nr:hypothetical protein [Portunus trituberculatus]
MGQDGDELRRMSKGRLDAITGQSVGFAIVGSGSTVVTLEILIEGQRTVWWMYPRGAALTRGLRSPRGSRPQYRRTIT